MGKIRVRTLGEEALENKQKEKSRLASEAKRAKQKAKEKKFVKGAKGGERVVSVGPSEEELQAVIATSPTPVKQASSFANAQSAPRNDKRTKQKKTKEHSRSKNYQTAAQIVDRSKKYNLSEALDILEKLNRSKFDETVELHINTIEIGVSGNITLPHTTGKQIRVAIADDDVLAKVALGKIDFDILLANPAMMPKLARVAKILGPKGLMPNPKNATLVKDPEKAAESFKKGQVNFRTEIKAPIMHLTVGKMSFGAKKLSENIQTLIDAIKKEKIRNLTLKSTMSPGIKIQL